MTDAFYGDLEEHGTVGQGAPILVFEKVLYFTAVLRYNKGKGKGYMTSQLVKLSI